nr:unnamed protein product [Callosobruchus chinensis]
MDKIDHNSKNALRIILFPSPGCMGCIDNFKLGPVIPAFTFGFAILACVQITDHVSPTHINPGVSLAFLIVGRMHWKKFLVYIVAQYIGCCMGYGLLRLTVTNMEGLCHLKVKEPLSVMQAFGTEIICSFTLMIIVFGAVDPRNASRTDSLAVRIALGAGLNAARSLPSAVFDMDWKDHWVYELGPPIGQCLAAILYRFVFSPTEKRSLYNFMLREKE